MITTAAELQRFDFPDEALAKITANLPPEAPPERVALLPELLRFWAQEDLREHLFREKQAVLRERTRRLISVGKQARAFLEIARTLDDESRFELALRPHTQRERKIGTAKLASADLLFRVEIEQAKLRCDEALSWLCDVATSLAEAEPKSPPHKRTRSYLIVRDLAAIFELVTCTKPSRRNNPIADSQPYGPFWDFVNGVCNALSGVRSIDRAIKDVMKFYPDREYSAFVANLQFRHPTLWHKLKGTP